MSKNNQPKVPVRFIEGNQELLKSQEGLAGQRLGTDWRDGEVQASHLPNMVPSYRTPPDRVRGNELFRRYPNGTLDLQGAKNLVVDALHRVKESGGHDQLNALEKVALSVLFPMSFEYVASGMEQAVAEVQLKLSPVEVMQIRELVASHLAEELNWNAGLGGGSVPGRNTTRE